MRGLPDPECLVGAMISLQSESGADEGLGKNHAIVLVEAAGAVAVEGLVAIPAIDPAEAGGADAFWLQDLRCEKARPLLHDAHESAQLQLGIGNARRT